MKYRLTATLALLATSQLGFAADIDSIQNLAQDEFKSFSKNLSSALSYKAIAPAEPLGLTGFDVGIEVTSTDITNSTIFDKAMSGNSFDSFILPKIHAHKGLPFGIDIGASYTKVPGSNISVTGAELRYAVIEGGVAMPAVAVRGTYSALSGVDQLDFKTKGLEASISKGFLMFTPYAGVGQIWADSKAKVGTLSKESFQQSKMFVGVNVNFGLMNIAVEGDKTGDATSYSAKVGLRF